MTIIHKEFLSSSRVWNSLFLHANDFKHLLLVYYNYYYYFLLPHDFQMVLMVPSSLFFQSFGF